MRFPYLTLFAASLIALSACASAPASNEAPAPSEAPAPEPTPTPTASQPSGEQGIFTSEQADRGQDGFIESCSECHSSSEFKGRQFTFSWGRRSVGDFYRHVVDNMPEDAPGSLTPQEYIDVVAYILEINGFPDGDQELPVDEDILETHPLTPPSSN